MKFLDANFSGSIQISGSLTIPKGTADQRPVNPETGSLFLELSNSGSNIIIYNGQSGSGWEIAGLHKNALRRTFGTPKADIEYLIIAGGASGGQLGGGGAGGYLSSSLSSINSGSQIQVVVGAGGAALSGLQGNNGTTSSLASLSGTSFTRIETTGGGGGGGQGTPDGREDGYDGGSGGGGGESDSGTGPGGSGTAGQGNDGGSGGGNGGTRLAGGGGGGAGATGADAAGESSGGNGGDGLASTITGTSTTRAGGGGGGSWYYNNQASSFGGTGGSGGGGNAGTTGTTAATAGGANTGGGGGGNGFNSGGYQIGNSGAGGSGVVILAYLSSSINAIGGQEGDAGNGRKYHQFNSSGTFYIGNTTDFKIVTDNLYAHYDLANISSYSGTGTTITDLKGSNDLTITSAPPFVNDNGGGLDFDGSADYAEKTSISYTPHVIDIWFNNHDTIGTGVMQGNYQTLASFGTYPFGVNLGAWSGIFTNETVNMFTNSSSGGVYIRDTISAGVHNMVWRWTGTAWKCYIDGTEKTVYTGGSGGQALRAATAISMGRGQGGNSYEFDGHIYEMRIYTDGLTGAQITQNYNALKNRFGL